MPAKPTHNSLLLRTSGGTAAAARHSSSSYLRRRRSSFSRSFSSSSFWMRRRSSSRIFSSAAFADLSSSMEENPLALISRSSSSRVFSSSLHSRSPKKAPPSNTATAINAKSQTIVRTLSFTFVLYQRRRLEQIRSRTESGRAWSDTPLPRCTPRSSSSAAAAAAAAVRPC